MDGWELSVYVCVREPATLPRAAPARSPTSSERVARVYTIRWLGAGNACVASRPSCDDNRRENTYSHWFFFSDNSESYGLHA
ncbi:unnamed protein product, partial [Iphiclides podalirius]